MNCKVGLIVESDWKLLSSSMKIIPKKLDPIIVIYNDDSMAYIDRFDCTAAETSLAQEHATKV
jgi:hypothetical protein